VRILHNIISEDSESKRVHAMGKIMAMAMAVANCLYLMQCLTAEQGDDS
jgi:hypothetical protein